MISIRRILRSEALLARGLLFVQVKCDPCAGFWGETARDPAINFALATCRASDRKHGRRWRRQALSAARRRALTRDRKRNAFVDDIPF